MRNGLSICNDFFRCSLPKNQQDTKHMTTYHDPRPIELANWAAGGKPLQIHRDPRRNMRFPCTHPECDHLSILRSGPYQHMRHCKFIKRDLQRAAVKSSYPSSSSSSALSSSAAKAPAATAALARSIRAQRRTLNHTIVPRGRVGRRSSLSTRAASSVRAASTSSASSASSGSIFDHTPPPRPATPTPTPSPPPPASTNTSSTTLTQLLTNMRHLAETVNRINKRLDTQTQSLGAMNKQMDWLAEQVDEIRTQNASLDAHTESLRNDMGMMEDHLGDMLQDNQKMKGYLRGAREDVGQVSLAFKDRGRQGNIYS
ncbi:hypothetical protein BGZ96_003339 [Linnemannia gamsii]|uniref:Uncharacterized protein n=1 Tax=Linnemannia gamsii TaxID=64522 RepID=A0ABQ7JJC1_9FUNG|nr:hypothetical protein BGZ96_003339 [Linnemannia gamsii]